MKHKLLFFGLLCCSTASLHAQEVVATQGDLYNAANGSLSFTVGETTIATASGGSGTLTQGFQQTSWNFVELDNAAPELAITLFPNPGTDYFTIQSTDYNGVSYVLTDVAGKAVSYGQVSSPNEVIQASQLSPGTYYLQLSQSQKTIKTYQLIKTK